MTTFLAICTVIAQCVVLVIVAAAIASWSGRPVLLERLHRSIGPEGLRLAWLVAAVAMAGSLYFSEVRNFAPCPLCWYQRICMYPLVALLAVAALSNDRRVGRYVWPLAGIGAVISIYHYQLERFPQQETAVCSTSVPCTTIWFEEFGYVTLPMMAFSAFALIGLLTWLAAERRNP
jgi:disulfide bond formation protein DsbB